MNDSHSPVFDPQGRYLYFLSDRDLNASVGAFDLSYVYDNPTRVYALTLRKDLPSPFAPESDEVKVGEEEKKEGEAAAGKGPKKEVPPIAVDLDGIEERTTAFPIEPGTLSHLTAGTTAVYYMTGPPPTLNGDGGDEKPNGVLHAFDLEKRKDAALISGIGGYDLSADGAKV